MYLQKMCSVEQDLFSKTKEAQCGDRVAGCEPGNEPVDSKEFWTFISLDTTPPALTFVSAPTRSSGVLTLVWTFDETVVSVNITVVQRDTGAEISAFSQSGRRNYKPRSVIS